MLLWNHRRRGARGMAEGDWGSMKRGRRAGRGAAARWECRQRLPGKRLGEDAVWVWAEEFVGQRGEMQSEMMYAMKVLD
jgi:hypothetical protein